MKQLFYIHGGMTFRNDKDYLAFLATRPLSIEPKIRWSDAYLDQELSDQLQIIRPRMPLQDYASYRDWQIHFERYFDLLEDGVVLVGQSLGGIFLAQYLSTNRFPKRVGGLYLVCPPFDDSVTGEDLVGGFELSDDLSQIESQCPVVRLYFSRDDESVPVSHAKMYAEKLPKSKLTIFDSKGGHFKVPDFPELVADIQADQSQ